MSRGFRQIEHTADIALQLWAPTEVDLLRVGAEAVVAHMTEDAGPGDAGWTREVTVSCLDSEDRLVRWLNEIIVLAVIDGMLYTDAEIELLDRGMTATVRFAGGHPKQELKAATYHDLKVKETANGWRAQVVIDV